MNNDDNIRDAANNEGNDPGFMDVPDDFKMGIRIIGPNDDPFEAGTNIDDLLYDLAKGKHSVTEFRDDVIKQMMTVLISRDKPNCMLVGPAGCGKTKIVEELAHRIADHKQNQIPYMLKGYRIYAVNLSDIVSGTGLAGSLETKVRSLIEFFEDEKNRAILFLDEVHMLFGGSDSYNKVAQILKPALSRGRIKVIAATTTQEVKRVDNDPAFNRRFTRIMVDELTKLQTQEILISSYKEACRHYKEIIDMDDNARKSVVDIADEFCSAGSHRPDNAITLLDRTIAEAVLERGQKHEKIKITTKMVEETAIKISSGNSKVRKFNEDLFRKELSVIHGQDGILDEFIKVIKLYDLHLRPRKKPLTFLFAGASGVGKTEVTKILANNYLGEKLIILNMAEYHSSASINRIIGAPAGYVGSDSSTELPFDVLDSNPYQVILLDEFEKCDRSVQRLFMSVFDEGVLKTNSGNTIDFSKAIIIATTNAGFTDRKNHIGFGVSDETEDLSVSDLSQYFDVELINRFSHRYTFNNIARSIYTEILADTYKRELAQIDLKKLGIGQSRYLPRELDKKRLEYLVEKSYVPSLGARPALTTVTEYIDNTILMLVERKRKRESKAKLAYVYCVEGN